MSLSDAEPVETYTVQADDPPVLWFANVTTFAGAAVAYRSPVGQLRRATMSGPEP